MTRRQSDSKEGSKRASDKKGAAAPVKVGKEVEAVQAEVSTEASVESSSVGTPTVGEA